MSGVLINLKSMTEAVRCLDSCPEGSHARFVEFVQQEGDTPPEVSACGGGALGYASNTSNPGDLANSDSNKKRFRTAICSHPIPPPPPRALKLVKEEVHRALHAFSTRPLKGATHPPLPSDLLRPFDVSKDGRVTYPEFKAGLRGLGLGLSSNEAEALARDVDGEGTGLVDRERFEMVAITDWGNKNVTDAKNATTPPPAVIPVATYGQNIGKACTCGERGVPSSEDGIVQSTLYGNRPVEQHQQQGNVERVKEERRGGATRAESGGGVNEYRHGDDRWYGRGFRDTSTNAASGNRFNARCDHLSPTNGYSGLDSRCIGHHERSGPEEHTFTTLEGQSLPLPPPPPLPPRTSKRQHPNETLGSKLKARTHAAQVVSFDDWRQMMANGDGGGDGGDGGGSGGKGASGERWKSTDRHRKRRSRNRRYTRDHSFDTLRCVSQDGQVFEDYDGPTSVSRRVNCPLQLLIHDSRREDLRHGHGDQCQQQRRQGQPACQLRRKGSGSGSSTTDSVGNVHKADSGWRSPRPEQGASVVGHTDRRHGSVDGDDRAAGDTPIPTLSQDEEFESAKRLYYANRAESALRLRSRGDFVGLRRALSQADPSASGVVSLSEMDRAILRRFGTGLGHDEVSELAARYRKDFGGCAMVDYEMLVDSLEGNELGLLRSDAVAAAGRAVPHQDKKQRGSCMAAVSSGTRFADAGIPQPVAAGARRRNSHRRWSSRLHESGGGGSSSSIPAPEESQLIRRARAKTLALLERHGTRSVDCVFGLMDPAHTESFTAQQLREGLCLLAGADPLSDVEHRVLFRATSKGGSRVKYKELLDMLQIEEAVESRERTQRKLAHQASLRTSGRGSGVHFRHSDVLDWYAPRGDEASSAVVTSGGRRHKEARRHALVFQRLGDRVKSIQEKRRGAKAVFDMFHQVEGRKESATGRGGVGGATLRRGRDEIDAKVCPANDVDEPNKSDGINDAHEDVPPSSLSPSALRTGLRFLGMPLGDKDFVALVTKADRDGRGQVSYKNFCETLGLDQIDFDVIDEKGGKANAGKEADHLKRPSSAPPLLASQAIGRGFSSSVSGERYPEGGDGRARPRVMRVLTSSSVASLDGGLFHRNPATDGCTNPNFTTTMIPPTWGVRDDGRHGNVYRPSRRPSPAPAPAAALTGVRPRVDGQTLLVCGGDDQCRVWSETGVEAERVFRRGFGVKARRRRSKSLPSCDSRRDGGCYDSWGTPAPRRGTRLSNVFGFNQENANTERGIDTSAGRFDSTMTIGSPVRCRNRRGRGHAPQDSDLGFGSERIRSGSRCSRGRARERPAHSAATAVGEGIHSQSRSRRTVAAAAKGAANTTSFEKEAPNPTPPRSLSLGAERRYGDWARSSIQHLLRNDSSLCVRSNPSMATDTSNDKGMVNGATTKPIGGYYSDDGVRATTTAYRDGRNTLLVPRNLRHPPQVTQRRASPYATDLDFRPSWPGGVRTGGGVDNIGHGDSNSNATRLGWTTSTSTRNLRHMSTAVASRTRDQHFFEANTPVGACG